MTLTLGSHTYPGVGMVPESNLRNEKHYEIHQRVMIKQKYNFISKHFYFYLKILSPCKVKTGKGYGAD